MKIRHLTQEDDLLAVSHIYEESWRAAYRGIVPQAYLDSIPPGQWVPYLQEAGRAVLVLLDGETPVGTASYGPARDVRFSGYGELISIYLLPEYVGRGHGRPLLEAALRALRQQNYKDVVLWVLEENRAARSFYEKAGFRCNGQVLEDTIGGKLLREMAYCRSLSSAKEGE